VSSALLSIVIPSFNCARFLERAVRSAYSLAFKGLEVIVVDDGSTDDTPQLCGELLRRYPSLRVIRRQNGGLSAARNTGMRASSGKFLLLLDADDELLSFDPQLVVDKDVEVLRVGVEDVSPEGIPTLHLDSAEVTKGAAYLHGRLIGADGKGLRVESWAYIYKLDFLRRNALEFPEGVLHEDTKFTIEALVHASTCAAVEMPVYRYIRRADSIMGKQSFAISARRIDSFEFILQSMMTLANTRRDVDVWLWAEHLVNVSWRYAARERSRRLALRVFGMELRLFCSYQLWGVFRSRRAVRYRLRLAVERLFLGPALQRSLV